MTKKLFFRDERVNSLNYLSDNGERKISRQQDTEDDGWFNTSQKVTKPTASVDQQESINVEGIWVTEGSFLE